MDCPSRRQCVFIDPGITYWRLIYLPRWLIPIRDGKVSLHPWEFVIIHYSPRWFKHGMSVWLAELNSDLCSLDCLFIHSMNTAIILNRHEIWISLLECLFVHTPKNCCFDVQPFKHQIPIYFCKSSLWHLQHIPWNWFSIPDHVHDHSQAWAGLLFGLLATSSRIKIIYGHLDDSSVLFQNRESGFYFIRILAAYTTKM